MAARANERQSRRSSSREDRRRERDHVRSSPGSLRVSRPVAPGFARESDDSRGKRGTFSRSSFGVHAPSGRWNSCAASGGAASRSRLTATPASVGCILKFLCDAVNRQPTDAWPLRYRESRHARTLGVPAANRANRRLRFSACTRLRSLFVAARASLSLSSAGSPISPTPFLHEFNYSQKREVRRPPVSPWRILFLFAWIKIKGDGYMYIISYVVSQYSI